MAKKAPSKHFRKGMTLIELLDMFPDDPTAEQWFVSVRWSDGIQCAYCNSKNITVRGSHPNQPYRCRDCRKFFSVKTNSMMHASNIGYRKWALAIYLMTTGLKGTSSMKLHRDIGVTQKTAWHMAHRIRETWAHSYTGVSGAKSAKGQFVSGTV